jgi:uncharacterized protein YndB with AHSA1/START domain
VKRIEQTYEIKAPIDKVWRALVDPKVIGEWGGGPAKMNAKEGSKFSLWGGDIYGTNTKVVVNKLLKQDWFSGNKWKEPSQVSFHLKQNGDNTEIKLVHTNVPDQDAKDIAQGWKDYYLGLLKDLLEQ